jgi:hypothetical protein
MSAVVMPERVPVAALPDPSGMVRSLGFLTPADATRLDALERASYVLVRIDGEAERWRCDRCRGKHAHFTLMCVERPFRGLRHGLLAYWQNLGAADPADLTPAQRERVGLLHSAFGGRGIPDLRRRHPGTARALATPETDLDVGAWVLGTLDPITPAKARQLADRINARARRVVVRI